MKNNEDREKSENLKKKQLQSMKNNEDSVEMELKRCWKAKKV